MNTDALISQLKQTSISKDIEKTKERVAEAWKAASKDDQNSILTKTNLTRPSLQRVYKTGSISAKVVVVMAQTLNLDPFYFTGEADERGVCSDDLLRAFLISYGYEKLLPAPVEERPKRRRQTKQKPVEQVEPVPAQIDAVVAEKPADPVVNVKLQESEPQEEVIEALYAAPESTSIDAETFIDTETQSFIDNATEDEIILLVKSILLRAKAGGEHAKTAQKLKLFLLS